MCEFFINYRAVRKSEHYRISRRWGKDMVQGLRLGLLLLAAWCCSMAGAVVIPVNPNYFRYIMWGSLSVPGVTCANYDDRVVFHLKQDRFPHSVTSGTRLDAKPGVLFDSFTLAPNSSFAMNARPLGYIPYFCKLNATMNSALLILRTVSALDTLHG